MRWTKTSKLTIMAQCSPKLIKVYAWYIENVKGNFVT